MMIAPLKIYNEMLKVKVGKYRIYDLGLTVSHCNGNKRSIPHNNWVYKK